MARRPDVRQDDVLTREELKQFQQRLSHLRVASVEEFYRSAHHRCSFQPRRPKSAHHARVGTGLEAFAQVARVIERKEVLKARIPFLFLVTA
jgi:hypothetical protein